MCDTIPHLWITSNDHFTKQIYLFSNQKLFGCYTSMIIYILNSFVFCGQRILVSHRRLRTPKHFHGLSPLEICITINTGCFTRGGIYPFMLLPDTSFLYHIIQPCDFVGLCPTLDSLPNQSPNAVLIFIYASHPFNTMSPCICNAMRHCMLYHVTCIMNATWTT